MSKYIIEIEDEPFVRQSALFGEEGLYRAKGFNSLVFDQFGLDKLTPLDKALEEAYQKGLHAGESKCEYCDEYKHGLDDAWKAAKKLFSEMSNTEINLVFPQEWNNGGFKALMALNPKDAIDRINAFERKQKSDEIKIGDEVRNKNHDVKWMAVVVEIDGDIIYLMDKSGAVEDYKSIYFEKTGRHFPQVEELLKAMKGDQQYCSTCKHLMVNNIECVDCKGYNRWEPKEDAE